MADRARTHAQTLVFVRTTLAVAFISIVTLARVTSARILARRVGRTGIQRWVGAFVHVTAAKSIARIPGVAFAVKTRSGVDTGGVRVARVGLSLAFVHVRARLSVSQESFGTVARVAARSVFARGVGVTGIQAAVRAFVDIRARGAVAVEAVFTRASKTSTGILACCIGRAVIQRSVRALVDIPTGSAVSGIPLNTFTRRYAVRIDTFGIGGAFQFLASYRASIIRR
jgi:hypothetical protein